MVNYRSLPDPYTNPLHNAAQRCTRHHVEFLRRLLASPGFRAVCPIDTRDVDDHTALHALCSYEGPCREDDRNAEDVEACLQLLVDAGADLDARDWFGRSPLHVLARPPLTNLGTEATLRLTSLLLRHGANVNSIDNDYDHPTLLHAAASSAHSSMVTLLVKAGASVHATNVDGETPLDIAIQRNLPILQRNGRAIVPILLRAGAKITNRNEIWYSSDTTGILWYLNRILIAQGNPSTGYVKGFNKLAQAHLATLTNTFEPKFPMLPKELVRHVVSFWLHAGYY